MSTETEMEQQKIIDCADKTDFDRDEELKHVTLNEFDDMLSNCSLNKRSCSMHTPEIVDILGGIDQILRNYVHISKDHGKIDQSHLLSEEQMQSISHLMNGKHRITKTAATDPEAESQTHTNINTATFCFRSTNTFLHAIFGENTARNIIKFLFNKYAVILFLTLTFMWSLCAWFIPNVHSIDWFFYSEMSFLWIAIFCLTLYILAANVETTKLICAGLDFWIKFGYSVSSLVLNCIYIRMLTDDDNECWYVDVSGILLTFVIIFFSLIEGVHVSWKIVTVLGFVISTIVTVHASRFMFWFGESEVLWQIVPNSQFSIELKGNIASSQRVLSIFLWRQTIMTAWYRGKSCISIYILPEIKWIKSSQSAQMQKNMLQQMN